MTDSSKNIGGFFVLFQALSIAIRLNATLAFVGIPASSRAEMVVDLTQRFEQTLLKLASSDISFIMSPSLFTPIG